MATDTKEKTQSSDKNLSLKKVGRPKAKSTEVSWSKPAWIDLSKIEIDQQYQCRSDIPSPDEYAAIAEGADGWPFSEPVKLVKIKGKLYLLGGFTRCEAIKKVGGEKVFAVTAEVTRDKALELALGENATHGYRRTNADKARAVRIALGKWPNRSANSIAKICKVSHTYVSNVMAKLKQVEEVEPKELEASPVQQVVNQAPVDSLAKASEDDSFEVPDYVESHTEQPSSEPPAQVGQSAKPHSMALNLTAEKIAAARAAVGKMVRALDEIGKTSACQAWIDSILKEIG